ncbi:MAG: TerB family tellurite resistance protein, partial [Candidatus Eremiobacterota bacterium]
MSNPHLADYNESERTDYMMVVASMAGADGDVSSEEIYAIRALSLHFVLGPEARGKVMAACTAGAEEMEDVIKRFADSKLKYSLLLDLANLAWADGELREPEEAEIRRLSGLLRVDAAQTRALL